jgi:hypothetical protein
LGLYWKRQVTLTDEPKLGYTKNPNRPFAKLVDLNEDTKVSKVNNTKFKITNIDTSTNIKREVAVFFKCNDNQ